MILKFLDQQRKKQAEAGKTTGKSGDFRPALAVAARFAAACAFLILATAGRAEPIPLYNGKTIDWEVLEHNEKGLIIRRGNEIRRLRWDQVDRSYPDHPLHGRVLPSERAAEKSGPRPETAASSGGGKDDEAAIEYAPTDTFFWFLVLAFVLFWLHVYAVWLLGRHQFYEGRKARLMNAAALFLGLPLVLWVIIRRHGFRGLAGAPGRGLLARDREAPPCRFYTWDNEELTPKSSRKLSSGLAVAELIMSRAVKTGASDVHLDTTPEGVRVAFRVDGVLRDPERLDADVGKRVMTAIKMAAGMDLAKIQEAQDGACHLQAGNEWYDLRVARAWAINGETLVVRLLRSGGIGADLASFGMLPEMVKAAEGLTDETSGIVIMTGPTGSGKTTTIYALLRRIEGTGRNILTIEDPVEYRLDQATQISLNPKLGSTFASALKASMRHDPDVILVGEIRDADTMDVAFQAALTGHLVFTTLHATSVLATLGRLRELGLSSYMINTGLRAILCQRLVKALCPSCRESFLPEPEEREFWDLSERESEAPRLFYRPVGCKLCEGTGYHGRRGVYRMLIMDNRIREYIKDDIAVGELQEVIDRVAMGTIGDYAETLLTTGVTSPQELRRTLDMFDFGKKLGSDHAS